MERVVPLQYRNMQFWNTNSLNYTPTFAVDLSASGARFVTAYDSDIGPDILMNLRLSDDRTVTVRGRKVWEQQDHNSANKVVGVAFSSLGLGGREAIESWVTENATEG